LWQIPTFETYTKGGRATQRKAIGQRLVGYVDKVTRKDNAEFSPHSLVVGCCDISFAVSGGNVGKGSNIFFGEIFFFIFSIPGKERILIYTLYILFLKLFLKKNLLPLKIGLTMDVAAETTKKECDSAVKSMARVPFVGRLHLYLPQFPSKPFPYFSASSIPSSNALEHTPPPTPPVSEPEISIFKAKEEEVEPTILEEANETDETLSENFSTCSSRLRRRTNVDVNDQEELTANDGPLWGNGSQEYIALGLSFLFLVFERILRIITIALREFFPSTYLCF
jgi:hypothetical protein